MLIVLIWGGTLTASWSALAADDAKAAAESETQESYRLETPTT